MPTLGKSKKDKEKALVKGELHDHLWAQQGIMISKLTKKRA